MGLFGFWGFNSLHHRIWQVLEALARKATRILVYARGVFSCHAEMRREKRQERDALFRSVVRRSGALGLLGVRSLA